MGTEFSAETPLTERQTTLAVRVPRGTSRTVIEYTVNATRAGHGTPGCFSTLVTVMTKVAPLRPAAAVGDSEHALARLTNTAVTLSSTAVSVGDDGAPFTG
jgi:hypothetical protein